MANGHGGKREGAGRKGIADEKERIKLMDEVAEPREVWDSLWKVAKKGNTHALRTWVEYRYGKPKDRIDVTSNEETIGSEWNLSKLNDKQLDALIALHGGKDTDSETSST